MMETIRNHWIKRNSPELNLRKLLRETAKFETIFEKNMHLSKHIFWTKLALSLHHETPPFCLNLTVTLPSEHTANFIGQDSFKFCPCTAKLEVFESANKAICVLQCSNV